MNDPLENLKEMSVLLVDDEPSIRMSLELMFKNKAKIFKTAADGKNALEWLQNNHCDIIICDYILPSMNGLDFFKIVDETCQGVIKVLITGYKDSAIKDNAAQAGIHEFLEKPMTAERIMATLEKAILGYRSIIAPG